MELSLSLVGAVFTILVSIFPGNSEHICDFDKSCLQIYNNMKSIHEDQPNDLATLCSLSHDLKDCMKKTSRKCRGNLNYHFFEKLVRDLNGNVGKNCVGGLVKGSEENNSSGNNNLSSGAHEISHHNHHGKVNGRGSRGRGPQGSDKCAPKVSPEASSVGCALFGLTNLKSFSETLNYTDINYCSLAGAWNLIDTPEFAVQITNKGGLSPLPKDITATTLVTVLIKQNQCSDRKTYQATFDEVPGMFSDGYTTAGNVFIETITESEHVRLHFPYLMTTIDVIKVLDKIPIPSLTVAIKMPEASVQELMSDPTKRLRGLPLCFYGCPRTAMKSKSESSSNMSARSASSSTNNYYKSKCPNPELVPDEEELPQGDASATTTSARGGKPIRPEETEFSGTLSAEFLSQSSSFANANTDFGGQRSQRSHSSTTTAVICASLNSVHEILSDTTVVGNKLQFPGDEGSENVHNRRHSHPDSDYVGYSSALTSRSSPISKFQFIFVYLTTFILIFGWS